MAATTSSTFVIYLQLPLGYHYYLFGRIEEFNIENATTNEQLVVQIACYDMELDPEDDVHYVELLRHPKGANAEIQEWLKERAYYEKSHKYDLDSMKMISIPRYSSSSFTIG